MRKEHENLEGDSALKKEEQPGVVDFAGEKDLGQKGDLVRNEENELKFVSGHDDLRPSLQVCRIICFLVLEP